MMTNNLRDYRFAKLAKRAADEDACAAAATATKCNPIERQIDSWEECSPVSVNFHYCNFGQVETIIDVKQDFGYGATPYLALCPDDLPRLIDALLAAQLAIVTLDACSWRRQVEQD